MGEEAVELYVFTDERVYRFIGVSLLVRDQPLWEAFLSTIRLHPGGRRRRAVTRGAARRQPRTRNGPGLTPGAVRRVRVGAGSGRLGVRLRDRLAGADDHVAAVGRLRRQVAEELLELLGVDGLLGDELLGQADQAVAVGGQDLRRPLVGRSMMARTSSSMVRATSSL